MTNCPKCDAALVERGSFCKSCGAQARCLNCKDVLEPEAAACVECGTLVGTKPAADASSQLSGGVGGSVQASIPPNRNTITFREDRNSRDFEASLTDSSMQSLGGVFGELFATRVGRPQAPMASKFFSRENPTIEVMPQLLAPEQLDPPVSQPPAPPVNAELVNVGKIFQPNGETLELIDNRLKATNGLGYVRRLTYLFLYAHEVHGRPWTPRDALFAVLREAKVLDSNGRHWLSGKKGFRPDAENRLQLIQSAREEAQKTLQEALDSNVKDVWNPDTRTVAKRAARKKKT